ncbi:MAG: RNA pseudouridine synthase [Treponema sp.]|jgi:23S rRNA pseudouridine1911/1915/1917 synthase|nr:RNA pseudouridine synthase [Treponema sp.]
MENKPALDVSRILYEDENCLVVNKRPGETAEGSTGNVTDLSPLLAAAYPGPFVPAAVHRLDVPVSGCLLFARTPQALSFLSGAFSGAGGRRVEKRYWAITEPPPPVPALRESGELIHWIKHDPRTNKTTAFEKSAPGLKQAVLRYRLVGRGQRYLFFEIELVTGRHHQIRAQLARLGLHIKGDLKYGARRSEKEGGIRLHARSLCFPNPARQDDTIRVTAPPPVRDNLWDAFNESAEIESKAAP